MEYFAIGFAVAIFLAAFMIYAASKLQDKQDNSKGPTEEPKVEGELEKDCFLVIFDREAKVLRAPKYKHQVEGPMAIDIYNWITGEREGEE